MSIIEKQPCLSDIDHVLVCQYQYAGFAPRLLANLIDLFLYLVVMLPVGLLFDPSSYTESTRLYYWTELALQLCVAVVYILCWMRYAATPGKVLMGLRVLNAETGENISFSQGMIRYLGYFVSAIVFCLGYLWIFLDDKKQAWHDKMAQTVVVQEVD